MELGQDRKRKLRLNSVTSLTNQLLTLVCGFVLPKLFLRFYGSGVNGLVTSITQFLNIITFLDLGVGTVVTSSLYKPLATKDVDEISRIFVSAKNFFKKIAVIFLAYIAVLFVIYPTCIATEYGFWYTSTLIVAIAITLFSQYFFGIVHQLLLNADQKTYVVMSISSITLLVNTIACAVLIVEGASIQVVKITTSLVFLARPAILSMYVSKHYKINQKIKFAGEPIKQKWNGLAQHLAFVVLNNTDSIVLTVFSTLENVSVYGVYNLVVNGVKTIFNSLTAGITALFGNMLAKDEKELLDKTFSDFEWLIHTATTLIFAICGLLIVPFVSIYTKGVNDANYIVPVFAAIITLANGTYCLRFPYNMMVLAAGHYKETQTSSFIEMGINIVISIAVVMRYGLVGVAVGTFCAMFYRTCYLAWYLSKNIIHRNLKHFIKHCAIDAGTAIIMVLVGGCFVQSCDSYVKWIVNACTVTAICLVIAIFINLIFYKENTLAEINKIVGKLKRR